VKLFVGGYTHFCRKGGNVKKYLSVPAVLCLVLLFGCKSNMPSFERGDANSPKKVLIAAEESTFKRNIVENLIDTIGTEDWYFNVIGIDGLNEADPEQYGAVLLICKMTGGRVEARTRAFLEEQDGNPKLIVLLTTGGKGELPDSAQSDIGTVDAVSSPSKTASVEETANELAALIEKRF
jgi:hypothetical protein